MKVKFKRIKKDKDEININRIKTDEDLVGHIKFQCRLLTSHPIDNGFWLNVQDKTGSIYVLFKEEEINIEEFKGNKLLIIEGTIAQDKKSKVYIQGDSIVKKDQPKDNLIPEIKTSEEEEKQSVPEEKPLKQEEPKLEKKKRGINQKLQEINEKLEHIAPDPKNTKIKKSLKLPYKVRGKLKKLSLKNRLLVFQLKTNRTIKPTIGEINNGLVVVDNKFHNCSTDFIFLWKGKYPAIVLPEWDLNPIGTKDYYTAIDNGRKVDAQEIIIRAMEAKENMMPKKLSGKMIIWLFIGAIVVFYVLFTGG